MTSSAETHPHLIVLRDAINNPVAGDLSRPLSSGPDIRPLTPQETVIAAGAVSAFVHIARGQEADHQGIFWNISTDPERNLDGAYRLRHNRTAASGYLAGLVRGENPQVDSLVVNTVVGFYLSEPHPQAQADLARQVEQLPLDDKALIAMLESPEGRNLALSIIERKRDLHISEQVIRLIADMAVQPDFAVPVADDTSTDHLTQDIPADQLTELADQSTSVRRLGHVDLHCTDAFELNRAVDDRVRTGLLVLELQRRGYANVQIAQEVADALQQRLQHTNSTLINGGNGSNWLVQHMAGHAETGYLYAAGQIREGKLTEKPKIETPGDKPDEPIPANYDQIKVPVNDSTLKRSGQIAQALYDFGAFEGVDSQRAQEYQRLATDYRALVRWSRRQAAKELPKRVEALFAQAAVLRQQDLEKEQAKRPAQVLTASGSAGKTGATDYTDRRNRRVTDITHADAIIAAAAAARQPVQQRTGSTEETV